MGIFPWGPVLDGNFTVPRDGWYEGWRERDWHFLWDTPEELIRRKKFNQGVSYMSGVTIQEAAYFICECNLIFVIAQLLTTSHWILLSLTPSNSCNTCGSILPDPRGCLQ